mgnify:CR=1 FL=1
METIIAYLYLCSGTLALAGYFPQLKTLFLTKRSPTDISLKTWTIWLAEGTIGLLYGIYCLEDLLFCLIVGTDCLFIMTIIGLVIHRRYVVYGQYDNFFGALCAYYVLPPFFGVKETENPEELRPCKVQAVPARKNREII